MEYVVYGVAALVFGGGFWLLFARLVSIDKTFNIIADKLSAMSSSEGRATVLLPVTKLDLKAECTTVLPLPVGAELCQHSMTVVVNQTISAPHEEKNVIVLQCTKCGAIDKTVTSTSKPPPPPPLPPQPVSECRHNWVKEKAVNLDSAFEQMEDVLKSQFKNTDVHSLPSWMFKKTTCISRLCTSCGAIDRVVVSNFEGEEEPEN